MTSFSISDQNTVRIQLGKYLFLSTKRKKNLNPETFLWLKENAMAIATSGGQIAHKTYFYLPLHFCANQKFITKISHTFFKSFI